jgi:hypothetical protein
MDYGRDVINQRKVGGWLQSQKKGQSTLKTAKLVLDMMWCKPNNRTIPKFTRSGVYNGLHGFTPKRPFIMRISRKRRLKRFQLCRRRWRVWGCHGRVKSAKSITGGFDTGIWWEFQRDSGDIWGYSTIFCGILEMMIVRSGKLNLDLWLDMSKSQHHKSKHQQSRVICAIHGDLC